MTDLVARYWQGGANAAVAHPAYSDIGLPNRDLSEHRKCLLHLANTTSTRVEDWRYCGKHALPLVLKTWVELANNSMRQHERAKPQEEPILIIDVYIITPRLCEAEHLNQTLYGYVEGRTRERSGGPQQTRRFLQLGCVHALPRESAIYLLHDLRLEDRLLHGRDLLCHHGHQPAPSQPSYSLLVADLGKARKL